jgi:tetratricopeptide (TPR) repeat protein
LYQRAYISTVQGRYEDAVRDYVSIQRQDPHFENTSYNKGVVYFLQGDYPAAESSLRHALRLYPAFPDGLFYLAKCYYETGRYAECATACRRLMVAEGPSGRAKALLVLAKTGAGPAADQ